MTLLIPTKDWTDGVIRVLPPPNHEPPGVELVYTSADISSGVMTPSPTLYDKDAPDPLGEWVKDPDNRRKLHQAGGGVMSKVWLTVLLGGEPEDIRIFPMARSLYFGVLELMLGTNDPGDDLPFGFPLTGRLAYQPATEEVPEIDPSGEDITHLTEGRDLFLTKTGSGRDTRWQGFYSKQKPATLQPGRLQRSLDEFQIEDHLPTFSIERYLQVYQAATGQLWPDFLEVFDRLRELQR